MVKFVIFLVEAIKFKSFTAKGTHYPDTRQVFLDKGHKLAFRLVGYAESLGYLGEKDTGIPGNDRDEKGSTERKRQVHPCHQKKCGGDQYCYSYDLQKLVCNKVAYNVHISRAALYRVARTVEGVPAEGQPLDMPEDPVAQAFKAAFGAVRKRKARHEGEKTLGQRTGENGHRTQIEI